MRILLLLALAITLSGCMRGSDLAAGANRQLSDVGLLQNSRLERQGNWRLQADSALLIAQSYYVPNGQGLPDNRLAEITFKGFVEYFPWLRRAIVPLDLQSALEEARRQQAHYLLYVRFASSGPALGEQPKAGSGVERSVVQLMLIEVGNGHLVDSVRISNRKGWFSADDTTLETQLSAPLREYAGRLLGLQPEAGG